MVGIRVNIQGFLAVGLGLMMLWGCNHSQKSESGLTMGPTLLLTESGSTYIKTHSQNPVIAHSLQNLKESLQNISTETLDFPYPQDAGGGYTHETHKANYLAALNSATLFFIDNNTEAFELTKYILLQYAEMYAQLPPHPQGKTQAPGRLFWQILNEEVALVHLIQAYDLIKSQLTPEERAIIEEGLFIPMVKVICVDNQKTYTKIHNHGMWAVAGVGMAGYVLNKPQWVESALYGVDSIGGFYQQIDQLFSPDGYYSEGPYYQRYALMPLVIFTQAVEANEPERNLWKYRNGIIGKAIETTVQLSTCSGNFFPINDAIASKNIRTPELGYALPLAFSLGGQDARWVEVMKDNGNIILTDALIGLPSQTDSRFVRSSQLYSDGPKGNMGGLAILRSDASCDGVTAILKFGTHGMGHGHFDQLGLLFYEAGQEVLSDYGAVRFHNIPQKRGGRYLKENDTWANQTIAHNTVSVNQETQYHQSDKEADQYAGEVLYFINTAEVKACGASNSSAYPGVDQQRHVAILDLDSLGTVVLDIFRVLANQQNTYDLPFYYEEELIFSNPQPQFFQGRIIPFGTSNGYQHLWHRATSDLTSKAQSTWLAGDHFRTLTTASLQPFAIEWVQTGANDPQDNLLHQEGLVYRSKTKNQVWASVLETHGSYDTDLEKTHGALPNIQALEVEERGGELVVTIHSMKAQYEVVLPTDKKNQTSTNPSIITIKKK
ncbi:MAG: hypothetical protein SchgKO_23550 [Schleiferiaceae bacterium]